MASEWKPRVRQYQLETSRIECPLEDCPPEEHPLKAIVVETIQAKKADKKSKKDKDESAIVDPLSAKEEIIDPLSQASFDPLSQTISDPLSQAVSDPLSAVLTENVKISSTFGAPVSKEEDRDITFEPWSSKRTGILEKYTTSEKIPITTSFLSNEERQKLETRATAVMEADKVKHRLEQLDDLEDGGQQETLNLSQKEYIRKIDTMNRSLTDAWQRDQRVMSLKITIQCSKLLADNGVIHFYPSKFVLITDILDNFGNLVFERIREKSAYTPPGSSKSIELPKNFSPEQVPESAKETCRNWFFKIASIRELVPRFYVEAALLNCYRFLTDQEFTQALIRLTKMTRGIGDPLVAAYARAYLCRVGQTVATSGREYVIINFTDYLNTFSQLNSDFVQNILAVQSLDMSKYLRLFVPAVEWILQCLAHKGTEKLLEEVIGLIKEKTSSGLVYNALISSFDPRFISKRALEFADLIKDSEETVVSKYELYVSLGNCVVIVDPPEKQKMPLLNNVWKPVMKLEDPSRYISCAQVWIEYVAKHFTRKEVNTLLGDIIKHMTPGKAFEDHYSEILSIINKILPYFTDFSQLFSMDKFLPYIDLCQKESVKVEASKNIVRSFTVKQTSDTNDPLIINGMMYLCKILHDSLDAMSLNDDRRQIGELITSFLGKISFGRDFEQQLSFYVEARAAFSNLDAVLIYLVHNVNLLAMQTRLLVKGNHNRKTASFVRACIAYSFITVPSIDAILYRLNLYLISGRVAVANGALSQGDAFFKAAVTALKEVPQYMDIDHRRQSTEDFAQSFFCNLFSTLLVIPDNPDREPLLLIRSVLNSLEDYNWIDNSDTKYKVYSIAICLLAAVCQDKYLYSIDKVDSNDALYSGEKKFTNEVVSLVSKVLTVIWNYIKGLTSPDDAKRQAKLALGLFARLSVHSDVTDPAVSKMLVNIWNIAQRENSGLSADLLGRIKSLVSGRKECMGLAGMLSVPTDTF